MLYIQIHIKRKKEEEEQIRSGIIRKGRHRELIIDIMRQKRETENEACLTREEMRVLEHLTESMNDNDE